MDSMFGLIDVIIIACGAYLIYGAIQLKNKGDLPTTLWTKDIPLSKCKDMTGFAAFMSPRLTICGAVVIVDGVLGLISDRMGTMTVLSVGCMILVIAVLVWYILFTRTARKRFF